MALETCNDHDSELAFDNRNGCPACIERDEVDHSECQDEIESLKEKLEELKERIHKMLKDETPIVEVHEETEVPF